MKPVAMRKLELHILKNDIDIVLSILGEAGCFQPAKLPENLEPRHALPLSDSSESRQGSSAIGLPDGSANSLAIALERLRSVRERLGLSKPSAIPPGVKLPGSAENALLETVYRRTQCLFEEVATLEARKRSVSEALEEARAFAGLELPFRELDHLSFLAVRIGRIDPGSLPSVAASLGDRAILVPIDETGTVVAAAAKKGRYALDTELSRAHFRPREFSPDFAGLPVELTAALESEFQRLTEESLKLEHKHSALAAEIAPAWEALMASYAVASCVEEVKSGLEATELVYRLEGWMPRDAVGRVGASLRKATEGRTAMRSYIPEELESVKSGKEAVPVLLKRRRFVSSFEGLVVSYGAPLYGTVDPTPVVAFFFVLLFSIMFGDLGQGAVILGTGIFLSRGSAKRFLKWKAFGPIFIAVGAGSMFMGFLDGTVFANEELLIPLTRALSLSLFGEARDRFIQIMPTQGIGQLFAFFGFTLGVGVLINSTGLVINIYNKFSLGKRGEAFFSKTGIAGALLFWWAIGIAIRVVLGGGPAWFDALGLGLPMLALFFGEPLSNLMDGKKAHDAGGMLGAGIHGFVEVIESISYYFSNSLSFLRVGAFALSHAVLSFIVFAMGDLVRVRAPFGIFWEILIVIIGNAVIIVLEGMIVAIQAVRLQYYEFFSKFFTDSGTLFAPFKFEYRKE